MAQLLDPTEVMFTSFEPKMSNRFIMYIEGIPAYLVKAAGRPEITNGKVTIDHINVKRYVKGRSEWSDLTITLYDPVVPSAAQAAMDEYEQSFVRARARQAVVRVESDDDNVAGNTETGWRIGATRLDVRPDGRR